MDNTGLTAMAKRETLILIAFSNFFKKERRGEERIWVVVKLVVEQEPTRTPVLNQNPTLRAMNTEREGGRGGESSQSETLPWAQRALREKEREWGGKKWGRRG
ncbi:hypothetical protein LOK49_LG14G00397 [Camellia lanceoleosa]|uniref:Uncharacterized protein n=1 Tax=Camellia lanceoleosa TaxID=1840588 RepID=A0ACC0FE76_9ERIC|nr:hypothetical protein LOK49_LG14G00397 [Camellia lanceoleosa]